MTTLNFLKQTKNYLGATLLFATLAVNAQEPLSTDNTEITGITLDYFFHQEPDTDPDKQDNLAENILDGDVVTNWAGNAEKLLPDVVEPILTFNLNGSYDLAEIQYLTIAKQYLFEVWVSTTETDDYTQAAFVNITPDNADNVMKDGTSFLASNVDVTYKSFDLGSNPGVTFVNIYCAGRTDSEWNTISELKFYSSEATASTRDNTLSQALVYPNPVKDVLNVTNLNGKVNKVDVVSLEGKVVISKEVKNSSEDLSLDTSKLVNGMYFLNFSNTAAKSNASRTIIVGGN